MKIDKILELGNREWQVSSVKAFSAALSRVCLKCNRGETFCRLSLETSVALRIDEAIREQACRKRSVCRCCVRDEELTAARKNCWSD